MMRTLLAASLCLCACSEANENPAITGREWQLLTIDGQGFDGAATLTITTDNAVQGTAPCNSYGSVLRAKPPDFVLGPVRATRRFCDAMDAERAYFDALGTVDRIEVRGGLLHLSGQGRTLTFQASP